MKKPNDLVDELMDNFNFHRVKIAMEVFNIRWSSAITRPDGVPTENEIRKTVREMLKVAVLEHQTLYKNGFRVSFDNKTEKLTLEFVLEHFTSL